jgi:hypothetical protein
MVTNIAKQLDARDRIYLRRFFFPDLECRPRAECSFGSMSGGNGRLSLK